MRRLLVLVTTCVFTVALASAVLAGCGKKDDGSEVTAPTNAQESASGGGAKTGAVKFDPAAAPKKPGR